MVSVRWWLVSAYLNRVKCGACQVTATPLKIRHRACVSRCLHHHQPCRFGRMAPLNGLCSCVCVCVYYIDMRTARSLDARIAHPQQPTANCNASQLQTISRPSCSPVANMAKSLDTSLGTRLLSSLGHLDFSEK